jgi:hypothetical protein
LVWRCLALDALISRGSSHAQVEGTAHVRDAYFAQQHNVLHFETQALSVCGDAVAADSDDGLNQPKIGHLETEVTNYAIANEDCAVQQKQILKAPKRINEARGLDFGRPSHSAKGDKIYVDIPIKLNRFSGSGQSGGGRGWLE